MAPDSVNVALSGDGTLRKDGGFWIAELPGGAKTRLFISRADAASLTVLAKISTTSLDLEPLTPWWTAARATGSHDNFSGRQSRWRVHHQYVPAADGEPVAKLDAAGRDFTPDGKAAIVATGNGDIVGILSDLGEFRRSVELHSVAAEPLTS